MNVRRTLLLGVAALGIAVLLRSEALAFAAIVVVLLAGLAQYTGRRILQRVEYSRSLSRRVVAWGGDVELSITVANRKWLPLMWLRVRDDWPSAVKPIGFTLSASHRPDTETLTQEHRGRHAEGCADHQRQKGRVHRAPDFGENPVLTRVGIPGSRGEEPEAILPDCRRGGEGDLQNNKDNREDREPRERVAQTAKGRVTGSLPTRWCLRYRLCFRHDSPDFLNALLFPNPPGGLPPVVRRFPVAPTFRSAHAGLKPGATQL